MRLSPDQKVFWEYGFIHINLTILTTWLLMAVMVFAAWVLTRKLKTTEKVPGWQAILEILVLGINNQIKEVGLQKPRKFIAFLGTLFLFIAFSNICTIIPWYEPPTGSLSTTAALSLAVFIGVPFFGIVEAGLVAYLRSYLQPTFIMLPFNIIGEISRTIALAVRLFGNIMSGGMIITILLSIAPFFFPVIMNVLGLLTGVVQAYIFSILAAVYITAATSDSKENTINHQKL